MSKKKTIFIAALVLLLAMLGTGTLAYFATSVVVHNVITTDGVDIQLVETMIGPDGKEVEFEDQEDAMPGQEFSKIVRVKNLDAEAWIRVKVVKTVTGEGKTLSEGVITLDYNTTDWVEKDGWYYYRQPLAYQQQTTPLFEEVHLSGPDMGNEYQNSTINIQVKAEAVQRANNDPQTPGDVTTVPGWPTT